MANADTPDDDLTARNNGAQGVGLCRTEHMFFASDERMKGELWISLFMNGKVIFKTEKYEERLKPPLQRNSLDGAAVKRGSGALPEGFVVAEILAPNLEKTSLSLHIQETTATVLTAAFTSKKARVEIVKVCEQCACLLNGTCCEKYCGCPKSCKDRFRGCHCAKGQCRSRQYLCFAADRECEPDVCRNCWISCGEAGYCVGSLNIEGFYAPWGDPSFTYLSNLASSLQILVDDSSGASDCRNEFGEPLIQSYARTIGMKLLSEERREWLMPIMQGLGGLITST
uniref:CXC domain-containing protein n=1 Tax=Vitis vinifera TaxID=29760 RepID=A5BZD1_VITVI|nr:hypothetical protein VITISV_022263 [Vitis vinifera]